VEAVLHKHLRESLAVHEQYHQVNSYVKNVAVTILGYLKELKQQYAQAQHRINQEARAAEQKVIQDFPHDPDAPGLCIPVHTILITISTQLERLVRLKEIEDLSAAKKESLKTKLQATVQMLADAYDR